MRHYLTTFIQIGPEAGIWESIMDVAGLVGVLLAIGVVVLWREVKTKDKALATLNDQVKEDGKESMRIITSMEALIDRMVSEQSNMERRVIESITKEIRSLKEQIREYKANHPQKNDSRDT